MKCIRTNIILVCMLCIACLFSFRARKTKQKYNFIKTKVLAMQKNNSCCSGDVIPFELRKFFISKKNKSVIY